MKASQCEGGLSPSAELSSLSLSISLPAEEMHINFGSKEAAKEFLSLV